MRGSTKSYGQVQWEALEEIQGELPRLTSPELEEEVPVRKNLIHLGISSKQEAAPKPY